MQKTIKAIGWAINILLILSLVLPFTIGVSLLNLLKPNSVGFGEPTVDFSDGFFSLRGPFYINNTGFYDLSEFNITIFLLNDEKTLSRVTNTFENILAGKIINSSYNTSISLEDIISKNIELLTNDKIINSTIYLKFKIAYAISFEISTTLPVPWKAPFSQLNLSDFDYNFKTKKLTSFLSFENHANFPINGTISIQFFNNNNEYLGSVEKIVNISSGMSFNSLFELPIEPSVITKSGFIHVYFDDFKLFEKRFDIDG